MNQLDQLKKFTTVVADSSDFNQFAGYAPRDATTNPSLVLKAVQSAGYRPLFEETVAASRGEPLSMMVNALLVRFGVEILRIVPGRVSTEVDARLSFDAAASVASARRIVELYEQAGVDRERILIKLAATWEGVQAARILEHEGIHCNMTLLFAFCQAVVAGDAGVTLVSPFVGRIHDWHKAAAGPAWDEAANSGAQDPGVQLAHRIYTYYRKFDIDTEVMGARFRNLEQIRALAGCDLLAISPALMAGLQASVAPLARVLDPQLAKQAEIHAVSFNEASFRYALNDDAMAGDQLAEGIRDFAADTRKLEQLIESSKA